MKLARACIPHQLFVTLAAIALIGCSSSNSDGTGLGGATGSAASGAGGAHPGAGGASSGAAGHTENAGGAGAPSAGSGNTAGGGTSGGSASTVGGATSAGSGNGTTGGLGSGGTVSTAGSGPSGAAGAAGGGMGGASGSAGASGSCPKTTLKLGDNNASITSGGETRTFIVHLPSGYTGSSPAPTIIDFHPLGGTGASQEASSGWKAKCDSVGCIAVFPDSSKKAGDNSWNAGYCCDNAEKNKIDDVQFARDIIKWLAQNSCVDSRRIYASGGSNGGGMTYRMACEAADVIAAVAPVDFRCVTGKDPLANAAQVTSANNTACTCTLPRPLTVIAWDEKADSSLVPYGGGQTGLATDCPPNSSCVGIGFSSAQVNAQTWALFDKCTGSAAADPNNPLCQTWPTCENGTQVSLCSTTSGGHLAVYGNASAKFTDTAWNALKTQALP